MTENQLLQNTTMENALNYYIQEKVYITILIDSWSLVG